MWITKTRQLKCDAAPKNAYLDSSVTQLFSKSIKDERQEATAQNGLRTAGEAALRLLVVLMRQLIALLFLMKSNLISELY